MLTKCLAYLKLADPSFNPALDITTVSTEYDKEYFSVSDYVASTKCNNFDFENLVVDRLVLRDLKKHLK